MYYYYYVGDWGGIVSLVLLRQRHTMTLWLAPGRQLVVGVAYYQQNQADSRSGILSVAPSRQLAVGVAYYNQY
jgi:hypothetical protein